MPAFFAPVIKRQIRAPINEHDKSTIVSVFPRLIHECKPTIFPGDFTIPAGSLENPGILVVGSSSWWKETDEGQPDLEVPQSSVMVADSIIKDWANGLLGCNMNDVMPGLFFLQGSLTALDVKVKHKDALERAIAKQKRWFEILVDMADALWANSNGNPRSISGDMKMAAEVLSIKNKGWLSNAISFSMKNCQFCGFLTNFDFPICQNCKNIVNPEKAKELGLKIG